MPPQLFCSDPPFLLYDLMRAARRDVHLGMDNTIKLNNSRRNINMRLGSGVWSGGTRGARGQDSGIRFPPAHFWHFIILLSIQKSRKQAQRAETGTKLGMGTWWGRQGDMSGPWPRPLRGECPAALPAYQLCQTRSFWLLVASRSVASFFAICFVCP